MTKQEQIEEIKQVLIKTCKRCRTFEEEPGKTGKAPGKTESGGSQKTA